MWRTRLSITRYLYLCLFLLAAPLAAAPASVRICYEANAQPPYSLGTSQVPQENPGLEIELIEHALQHAGVKAEFYRRSWKRCLADLEEGRSDGLFSLIWTAERELWAAFPMDVSGQIDRDRYLWTGVYRVYVRRDSRVNWDGKRFSGLNYGVGAPLGYISYQRLQALGALSSQHVEHREGLQLVASGRMDGYVMDQLIGAGIVQELELDGVLMPLPVPFLQQPWYLVFAPDFYRAHPEEAEKIWTALGERRRLEGDALLQKYLLLE